MRPASRSLSARAARLAGDDELVAAETGDDRVAVRGFLEAAGDFGEHAVADRVAERVVDFLEAVEVEPEQRQLAVRIARHHDFDRGSWLRPARLARLVTTSVRARVCIFSASLALVLSARRPIP